MSGLRVEEVWEPNPDEAKGLRISAETKMFLLWLSIRNAEESIRIGEADSLLQWQKAYMNRQFGWHRRLEPLDMADDITRIARNAEEEYVKEAGLWVKF